MYIPLYLWAKGRLSIGDRWYKFHLSDPDQAVEYAQRWASLGMLFYPLAHSLVVLPLSVARWSMYSHHNIPSATMFFGLTMFNLSGAINVFLFLTIRPQLLLFAPLETPAEAETQMSHLNPGLVILPNPVQSERSPMRIGLVDDLGKRSWNDGSRNGGASSQVDSTQRVDDI